MSDDQTADSALPVRRPAAASGARAHLEAKSGPEKGTTFRVAPGVTLIGRDPSCDVQLTETVISRQHCRIDRQGDDWILRNLSSNGTRVKRKTIEEHVLSGGDEIRIGAKTRLIFVVEEIEQAGGARPQFRPRTADADAADIEAKAKEEAEAEAEAEGDEDVPLLKRRRGLFIGLAVYMGVLVIGGVVAALYFRGDGGTSGPRGIPRLAMETRILPAGGGMPLRIDRTDPAGIWCVTEQGNQVLVPHEDIATGRARRVPGIRQAIDIEYITPREFERLKRTGKVSPDFPYVLERPRNGQLAERYKREAIQAYLVSDLHGNESKLFQAVRYFQKALSHYNSRVLADPADDRIRQNANKKLIEKINTLYSQAVIYEKAGDFTKASGTYEKLLDYVPERSNIIYRNVTRRLTDVRRRVKEGKR